MLVMKEKTHHVSGDADADADGNAEADDNE